MNEPKLETKGEFAARLNVTPGRLSQMIAEGKVPPDALVGEGRKAKVDIARAMAALDRTLDLAQRTGANGRVRIVSTTPPVAVEVSIDADASTDPEAPSPVSQRSGLDDDLRRESLEQKRIETRRMIRAEAAAAGDLVSASEVRTATDKIVARMIEAVDQAMIEMASTIAGEYALSRRDLLHLLRKIWREQREKQSEAFAARAAESPVEAEATIDLQ